jgi:branched-chain amino acid transport system substrate-binding protein
MRNLLLAVLSLALFVSPAFAAGKPLVKIGVSAPLTGDNAHLGETMRDAMTMASENLSADTKYDYQIIFEDDALEAKKAAAAANKLVSVDKVDALASLSSGTGGVISPIAEQNKIIHFGIASAQSVADGDFNFIHWTSPVEQARKMSEELQKRGIRKLAIIELNHPAFIEMRDRLKEGLAGSSVEIVSDQMANPGEKDFRSVIAKAKETGPDLYMLLFFSPELEILAKQIREAGIQTGLTAIESFGLSSEPQLYEGQWYVDAGDAKKEFYEKYITRFGKAPQLGAPNAYDIVNIIVYGFEHADAPPGVKPREENVVRALHAIKGLDGMMGTISIDDKGVVFSPAAVKTIKDGKPVALTE